MLFGSAVDPEVRHKHHTSVHLFTTYGEHELNSQERILIQLSQTLAISHIYTKLSTLYSIASGFDVVPGKYIPIPIQTVVLDFEFVSLFRLGRLFQHYLGSYKPLTKKLVVRHLLIIAIISPSQAPASLD